MKLQKNGFSFCLWALYYIIISLSFAVGSIWLGKFFGITEKSWMVLLVCSFFILEILLFFLLHALFRHIRKWAGCVDKNVYVRMEWILAVFFVGMALAARIGYIHANAYVIAKDRSFYEIAASSVGGRVPFLAHNASYVYVRMLSWLFSCAGSRPSVAVYFQMVLQILVMAVFYFSVRRLLGKAAAVFYLLMAAFLPAFIVNINVISPEILICFFVGAALLAVSYAYEQFGMKKTEKYYASLPLFFRVGILIALGAYLDIYGIVVFLAVFAGIWMLEKKGEHGFFAKERGIASLCLFLGFLLGALFFLGVEVIVTGESFWGTVQNYLSVYRRPFLFQAPVFSEGEQLAAYMVLCMMAGFGVIGFFCQKWQRFGVVSILLAGGLSLVASGQNPVSYPVLTGILWMLAACVGVQYFADLWKEGLQEEKMEEKQEEETGEKQEEETEEKQEEETEEKQEMKKKEGEEKAETINYIPNPLPVPRRHVRKELDYSFEPEDADMEYDLKELSDGADDFDQV